MTASITLEDVTLTLQSRGGPVNILRGISLAAEAGRALALVGPSGSGKTSLLMVMAGLEPVTSGKVTAAGHELSAMNEQALTRFRRDTIGIVFQSFHLIPTLQALENVAVPLEFRGDKNAFAKAGAALERVGLGHRLKHYPGQLSGGEQQRVAIARAVASGAKIILADEPTGNLDQDTGKKIIDLLFEMQENEGATLVLVTHDRSLAQRCNRIIEVRDGLVSA